MKKCIVFLCCVFIWTGIAFSAENDLLTQALIKEVVEYNLPGAMVIVVKEGIPVYAQPFGKANHEDGIQMDLQDTIIQTGSMSKVVTSYALLQLMDMYEIDLDDSIAPYLPSYLEPHPAFGELTFNHVLTHTTGIPSLKTNTAQRLSPIGLREDSFSKTAELFLTKYKHAGVLASGQYVMLSNVNNILAGVLIESISGDTFENYVSSRLLRPSGMRTSAEMLQGGDLKTKVLAQPYRVFGGRYSPLGHFQAMHLPSDDFLTTGNDMINLMVKIQKTPYQLLDAKAQNSLWMPGRSAGFSIVTYKGVELYLQDGGIPGANARLIFIPSYDLSVFIYYNSDVLDAKDGMMHAVLDHFLSLENYQFAIEPYAHFGLNQFTGVYSPLNASNETVERLTQILYQIRVTPMNQGIMIDKTFYEPVSETVFYDSVSNQFVEFKTDADGKLSHLVIGNQVYKKAPIHQSMLIETTLLFLAMTINLLVLALMLFKWSDLKLHRIHDTPRYVLLAHALVLSGLLVSIVLVATQYNFWNVIFNDGKGLLVLKSLGWLNAIFVLPVYMVLRRVKEDFRWSPLMRFVFSTHWLLSAFLFVWLWRYHLV